MSVLVHFRKPTHHFFVSFVNCERMPRLTLGASAYTFYGFSYFFHRQTLRGGRETELRKGELHSQQQPDILEQKQLIR